MERKAQKLQNTKNSWAPPINTKNQNRKSEGIFLTFSDFSSLFESISEFFVTFLIDIFGFLF